MMQRGSLGSTKIQARTDRMPRYFQAPLLIFTMFLIWVWARYIQIGVRGGGILGQFRFEFVLGAVLIVITLWVLLEAPLILKRSRFVVLGITLLFLTMIFHIPFAAAPAYAQSVFIDRVVKFAFMTFFMVVLIRSPQALAWFLVVFLISIFWITQESVRGLISGGLVWQNQGVMRLHGAVPIYAHPNSLGGVSMGAVPFVAFLWPVWKRWWMRLGLLAVLTTSLVCVIFSGSRTSYVALLAFLLFWLSRVKRKSRWILGAIILGPVAIALLPDQYIERFETIGADERDSSQSARIQIMKDAWTVFLENPAGVGLGCFPIVRAQRFGRSQDTHNLYLEVATNMGVQGLAVFLFFVGAMMMGFFDAYRGYDSQILVILGLSGFSSDKSACAAVSNHVADLEFLKAVANATAGFIFIRLALGMFGMDLYEVYWWFGAGIAIVLLEMTSRTYLRTRFLKRVMSR